MRPLPNIALSARSGAGKSIASDYLQNTYGYALCRPGAICREITERLFGTQSKTMLNKVNDAMRAIDPDVWLRVALQELGALRPGTPICVDGMRFKSNVEYCRKNSFVLVTIDASEETRMRRLKARGQEYDVQVDAAHAVETEIEGIPFDHVIRNDGDDPRLLYKEIDKILVDR
jgi:dephospho-CoA kinase